MTARNTLLAGLSAIALGFAAMPAAFAQEPAPAPAPAMEPPAAAPEAPAPAAPEAPAAAPEAPAAPAAELGDEKLKSFAMAFLEVAKVTQDYQQQITDAGSPEDQQRLQQEAGEKMVEAVNDAEGISVDEYNQIIQAAQADPDLAQRINGHITEAAGSEQ